MAVGNGIEAVSLGGMKQSANVHLQTLENHRMSYQNMANLAREAEAGWQGKAGANFRQALEAWLANYEIIGRVLDQMHARIVANGAALTNTHEATTQTAASIGSVMAQPVPLKGF